ncbi:MAG: DUF3343 domain-containing protein [Oscillospiraceae bacterium]|jgi:hypothetical protein|nr:DUF3343 domain-containing protein [Oscillospiraceae bacterium]MBQ5468504.1 DUF3343 domain-containing protein [Oscillospiraceae bacterium]MBQ6281408.1 DUF3343 domain-containing protein [Oscillospiraceae bacterium]MBQ9373722.1 DUF3343 domain-containing protein [Oscillospiraceae bacterium]MEE3458304.1 putative Se/S carrier-like protein [Candidatus Faecousia sp.]
MLDVYLIYRSVTHGQGAAAVVQRAGLRSRLIRSPANLAPSGCAYALTLRRADAGAALSALRRAGNAPASVWLRTADGRYGRWEP